MSKAITITVFVDNDAQVAEVLEILNRPLSAFVLEGKNVHLSLMENIDEN